MLFDTETTAGKLAGMCESWSVRELVEAIAFYQVLAEVDEWYEPHVRELQTELQARKESGDLR